MSPDFRSPSDAELRLLEMLWRLGPRTVREVAHELYGEPSTVQYRTVQVQLDRLSKKGLVERDRDGRPQRFKALVDRSHFIGEELQTMADRVCEGSLAPLLLNLAGRAKLSDDQRDALMKIIESTEDDDAGESAESDAADPRTNEQRSEEGQ